MREDEDDLFLVAIVDLFVQLQVHFTVLKESEEFFSVSREDAGGVDPDFFGRHNEWLYWWLGWYRRWVLIGLRLARCFGCFLFPRRACCAHERVGDILGFFFKVGVEFFFR